MVPRLGVKPSSESVPKMIGTELALCPSMAVTLKNEKTSFTRQVAFGRHFLRAVLTFIFTAVTVVLVLQGVSMRTAAQWLLYLGLFVATDQIANLVLTRIARQSDHGTHPSPGDPDSRLSH